MSEKKIRNMSKMMAGKLEVIRDVDSNHRTEVAQVCVCSLTLHSGHVFKKMGFY